jgi:hypothetical protein
MLTAIAQDFHAKVKLSRTHIMDGEDRAECLLDMLHSAQLGSCNKEIINVH